MPAPAIPTPEPTPIPPVDEPPDILIQIPPLEGEFLELEEELQSTLPIFTVPENQNAWCRLLQNGEVFTYRDNSSPDEFISINRINDEIYEYIHVFPNSQNIYSVAKPSWGRLVVNETTNYRLAFNCDKMFIGFIFLFGIVCYWDTATDTYHNLDRRTGGAGNTLISPNGQRIAFQDDIFRTSILNPQIYIDSLDDANDIIIP